jgi:putative ABC transport system permease protein
MRNILPITLANLRRGKSQAVSLLIFVLVAALLLNIGLLLMLSFGNFFDERGEALDAPHYVLVEEERLFTRAQLEYLEDYAGVTKTEHETALFCVGDIAYSNGKMLSHFIFLDASAGRSMNDLALMEGATPKTADEICLPYAFKVGGGYALGDVFTITANDKERGFTISGFSEEIMLGSINNQLFQVYLSPLGYDRLAQDMPGAKCEVIRVRLQDPSDSETLFRDSAQEFWYKADIPEADSLYVHTVTWNSVKQLRTMMSSITSIVLVVFAAIIVLVSLLVARFRIRNSIEEGMTNIGALKAVGYTGTQLLRATLLQFALITVAGTVVGIGLSYAVLPLVSQVLESQTALLWQQGFDPLCSLITFVSILLTALVVTWLSARRIRTLQPLAALRQGLATHSFRHNYLPLDTSKGALTGLLALKSTLQSKGQMITIGIIVATVTFAAAAGVSIYDNLALHPDAFGRLLSGEMPDAAFFVDSPDNAEKIRASIEDDKRARKVFSYQNFLVMAENYGVNTIAIEDSTLLEGDLLYEGRYPEHDNEIAISGILSAQTGKAIGDSIEVTQGAQTAAYLVVGLIQTVNNNGLACMLAASGVERIQPDFRFRELYVYMQDSEQTAEFVESVSQRFGTSINSAVNLSELMDAQLGVYGDIFQVVAIVVVVVTALVIFMVLYLMLKNRDTPSQAGTRHPQGTGLYNLATHEPAHAAIYSCDHTGDSGGRDCRNIRLQPHLCGTDPGNGHHDGLHARTCWHDCHHVRGTRGTGLRSGPADCQANPQSLRLRPGKRVTFDEGYVQAVRGAHGRRRLLRASAR